MNHYTNLESEINMETGRLEITAEYDGGKFLVIVEYTEDQLQKKFKSEFEKQKVWNSQTWWQPAEHGPSGEMLSLEEWRNEFLTKSTAEMLFKEAGIEENNLTIIEP